MLMFVAMLSPRTSAWLFRSSGASPTPAETAASTDPGRSGHAFDLDGAAVALAGTEDGLEDLGAAGSDEPREAEDLARAAR